MKDNCIVNLYAAHNHSLIISAHMRTKLTQVRLIKASASKSHRQLADDFKIGRTQFGLTFKRKAKSVDTY